MMNNYTRMTATTTFIAIFFASIASASWSAFANVNQKNQSKYKITVKTSVSKNDQITYQIKAPMVGEHKHCWLIICKSKLKLKQQEFRDYIWNDKSDRSDVWLKVPVVPDKKGIIQFTIHKEFIPRSYIYIDFPHMVFDGGYYYSIDLSTYIKKQ